jgi:hypothetical protein
MSKVLYVRVTHTAHAYVAALSAHTGLSMSVITALIIEEAQRRRWQITANGPRITDTSGSPAADSHGPAPTGPGSRDQGRAVDVPPHSAPGPLGGQ